jgi:hypothetical protein
MKPLLPLLLIAAASLVQAQPATRAEVAAQRAAIEQRFAREQQACEQRFAVSPCIEDVRRQRQAELAPLVRREHELAAEERRARADSQASRARARDLAAAQDEGKRRERLVVMPPPAAPAVPAARTAKARNPVVAAHERERAASQAEAAAAERRERAQERQQRMQKRLAERQQRDASRTKPLAPPLPLPGASAASDVR